MLFSSASAAVRSFKRVEAVIKGADKAEERRAPYVPLPEEGRPSRHRRGRDDMTSVDDDYDDEEKIEGRLSSL